MKSCFLCDCKSCPNWGIDGYYGLCNEDASCDPPDDNESEADNGDEEE